MPLVLCSGSALLLGLVNTDYTLAALLINTVIKGFLALFPNWLDTLLHEIIFTTFKESFTG